MMNRRLEMLLLVGLLVGMSVGLTGAQQDVEVPAESGNRYNFDFSNPVPLPPKFWVNVKVTCDDAMLVSEIESYLKRELRSLGDVKISNSNDHVLSVVVVENRYRASRRKTGQVALAYLGLLTVDQSQFLSLYKEDCGFPLLFRHELLTAWKKDHLFGVIKGVSPNNLKATCESVVAAFDTDLLEPQRQKRNIR